MVLRLITANAVSMVMADYITAMLQRTPMSAFRGACYKIALIRTIINRTAGFLFPHFSHPADLRIALNPGADGQLQRRCEHDPVPLSARPGVLAVELFRRFTDG